MKGTEKKYGVVTGWGGETNTGKPSETLKQMQMEVKSDKECVAHLNQDEMKDGDLSSGLMFCAGGSGNVVADLISAISFFFSYNDRAHVIS